MNAYKMYKSPSGDRHVGKLHVPAQVAELIPDDQLFTIHLTDEGIVYRPIDTPIPLWDHVPEWVEPVSSD